MENSIEQKVSFELLSLSNAENYQKWILESVEPYLGKRILELGAGIGNLSRHLPLREKLVLSETDDHLLRLLDDKFKNQPDPRREIFKVDLMSDWLDRLAKFDFDTIVSFNVMEHIEDDLNSFNDQIQLLKKSKAVGPKHLVAFVPSQQWAYGTLDSEFLHFRRYSKRKILKQLRAAHPDLRFHGTHFNLVGLLGWFVNGRLLGKKTISDSTIKSFELLCPLLKDFDNFIHQKLGLPLGQSLVLIAEVP